MTIEKGGSEAVAFPSVTVITMAAVVPTSDGEGVPEIAPLDRFRFAHPGSPVALTDTTSPSGSPTTGAKLHTSPTVAVSWGVPLMMGARLGGCSAGTGGCPTFSWDSGKHAVSAVLASNANSAKRHLPIVIESLRRGRNAGMDGHNTEC
jgi:hypothetical protein